ncbi:MAG: BrnT family toxin [Chitinispirillaceae bacterium]|nr:BrnT family toxin [Chitinispirillaceae bacterium]
MSNLKKHGIHFEEATTVFYDDNAKEYYDPDHSENEKRYIMLGMSRKLRVLIVSYCYRKSDATIRIISSRKANNKETRSYFAGGRL